MKLKEKFNEEKRAEIKQKIKKHAPDIIVIGTAFAAVVIGVVHLKKTVQSASSADGSANHEVQYVDSETRKAMMEDDSFVLYKLNGSPFNEYILGQYDNIK